MLSFDEIGQSYQRVIKENGGPAQTHRARPPWSKQQTLKRQHHIELQPRLGRIVEADRLINKIDKMILRGQREARKKYIIEGDEVTHDVGSLLAG